MYTFFSIKCNKDMWVYSQCLLPYLGHETPLLPSQEGGVVGKGVGVRPTTSHSQDGVSPASQIARRLKGAAHFCDWRLTPCPPPQPIQPTLPHLLPPPPIPNRLFAGRRLPRLKWRAARHLVDFIGATRRRGSITLCPAPDPGGWRAVRG